MAGYADPELLVSQWLHERLDGCKMWADPELPPDWPFTAPIGHVQRGPGEGDTVLTLDSALLDIDFYAKNADHARQMAGRARDELRLHLPGHTWPSGVTVSAVGTVTAPFWAPDPSVYKRSATYRVVFHGLVQ
ncbi:hypothetical protein ABZ671_00840 [Micromonospora sp. NPDC006766]|uniref:hypothetical protein n=1 Tax=Micromonospora sp. NPDC006766 TaxID=3154778 RepID=UPI0033D5B7BC